jgi:hypothetical protein
MRALHRYENESGDAFSVPRHFGRPSVMIAYQLTGPFYCLRVQDARIVTTMVPLQAREYHKTVVRSQSVSICWHCGTAAQWRRAASNPPAVLFVSRRTSSHSGTEGSSGATISTTIQLTVEPASECWSDNLSVSERHVGRVIVAQSYASYEPAHASL